MICRTCKGTGKIHVREVIHYRGGHELRTKKACPDCYGSGKVINKGDSDAQGRLR